MNKRNRKILDLACIFSSVILFVLLLVWPENRLLKFSSVVLGILGLLYLFRTLRLLFYMPKFDWHLIHGNFLRKVICFVMMMPFMLFLVPELSGGADSYNMFGNGETHKGISMLWGIFYHFVDPGNQYMVNAESTRMLVAVTSMLGVFLLEGLLVSSLTGWCSDRKSLWTEGKVRYNRYLKHVPHYVVIGGNDLVASVVKQLLASEQSAATVDVGTGIIARIRRRIMGPPYIVVQTSGNVDEFRQRLFSQLTEREQERVIVYYGNRTSAKDIASLMLNRAMEVYILGEETRTDDLESYHDTMNMECLRLVYEDYVSYKPSSGKKITCRVMFEYQTTFSVFQFYGLEDEISEYVDFKPFNYYELWSQKVFINRNLDKCSIESSPYLPLEGTEPIGYESEDYVHLFIVGMSRMGVAMGIEAAHLAHYPNFENKGVRTKVTFIDYKADVEKDFFMGRFKELFSLSHWRYGSVGCDGCLDWKKVYSPGEEFSHLGGDFIDIEWEFINGGIENDAVRKYILDSAKPEARVTIAVCLPESNRSHAAALYLPTEVYENNSVVQVLVYNRYGNSVIKALDSKTIRYPYLGKLRSFGMPSECINREFLSVSEIIGEEVAKAYGTASADKKDCEKQPFDGKSEMAKLWSSIYSGNTLWTKLRSIGFPCDGEAISEKNVEILSDVEHNRWNVEQLLMRFRPPTDTEMKDVAAGKLSKKELKYRMTHLNICSNAIVKSPDYVDFGVRKFDDVISRKLPEIYDGITRSVRKVEETE
ncbi:MAG: hypothetical protein IKL75_05965 [Bacteroidaceae bacterium]|nr:hypothetical protein [Bacteroidaceae bacterium]